MARLPSRDPRRVPRPGDVVRCVPAVGAHTRRVREYPDQAGKVAWTALEQCRRAPSWGAMSLRQWRRWAAVGAVLEWGQVDPATGG